MSRPAAKALGGLLPDLRLDAATAAVPIIGIASDSRRVRPGYLFAAVPGSKADGASFVPAAVNAGAAAILAEHAPADPVGVPVVLVADVRTALAKAAARLFAPMPKTIVAVTGTAGKTSVAHFTRQIWAQCGVEAAYLGTLGLITPEQQRSGALTTPPPRRPRTGWTSAGSTA
jgi:UDP-N-acetylmuramoyl-L-alanyl-D-glutamate--2,6-diaminopimelate ligase